jgi:hypothetical protein
MSPDNSKPSITQTVVLDIIISGVLPYIIYRSSVSQLGEWPALILASVPPLLKSARELILRHRVDTIGALALAGILSSLISLSLGGSARMLLLRSIVITGLFGVIYLGSLLFAQPLIFYIVRFFETGDTPEGIGQWNELWGTSTTFRYGMRLMTIVWGIGLLTEALLRFVLVQVLTIEQFLLISPFIGNGFNFGLIFWSFWYGNRMKRS